MKQALLAIGMGLLLLGACSSRDEQVESQQQIGSVTQAATDDWPMPTQDEVEDQHTLTVAEPGVALPALRHATQDEIEEVNETFRTPGSQARMIARIAHAQASGSTELADVLSGTFSKALDKLPASDQVEARVKLTQQLGRKVGTP